VLVTSDEFTTSSDGWVFVPVLGTTTGTYAGEALNTTGTAYGDFGFWISPPNRVQFIPDSVYHGVFILSSDQMDPTLVPQVRMRANSDDGQYATVLLLESVTPAAIMPGPTPSQYDMLFTAPPQPLTEQGAGLTLSFDMVDFMPDNDPTAQVMLNDCYVLRASATTLRQSLTTVAVYDFEAGDDGWSFLGVLGTPLPTGSATTGALNIEFATNMGAFGYWASPAGPPAPTTAVIVADYTMSTDIIDPAIVPTIRLRMGSASGQQGSYVAINSTESGGTSPELAPAMATLWAWPQPAIAGEDLNFAFDLVNFDPNDAASGRISLEEIRIQTLPMDLIPHL